MESGYQPRWQQPPWTAWTFSEPPSYSDTESRDHLPNVSPHLRTADHKLITLNQSPNVSRLLTCPSLVSHLYLTLCPRPLICLSLASQLYLTCMSRCLTCLQLWKLCPSPRQRLRAAVSGWLLESSSLSCWLSSSSSSFTGSCAVRRSWSSSQMPSTQSSRDRRSEVNRKFLTLSCPVCNH